MDLATIALMTVVTGYGDPVDGFPSAEERQLVLWTNAARVAPTEFKTEYTAGGCSTADFSDDEKTAKAPLYVDLDLTEVARVHSKDMRDNGCFQHESCDGTDTWTRVGKYYHDANSGLGENIAYGTTDPKYAVLSMWMCSHSGHRANIMSGGFNEMGGGMASDYLTQDFAGGELNEGDPPVRMAAEYGGAVWADWGDSAAPASLVLVAGDSETDLSFEYGASDNGIYAAALEVDEGTPWRVEWSTKGGDAGSFPATGGFLAGTSKDDYDAGADFGGGGAGSGSGDGSDIDGTDGVIKLPELMCATSGDVSAVAALAGLALALRRRSRR